MKKLLLILSIPIGTVVFLFYVLQIFAGCQTTKLSDTIEIQKPEGLGFRDFCVIGNNLYFLYWGSPSIHVLRDNSINPLQNNPVVPLCGEYGVGNLQFQSPYCIKAYKDQLVVSDLENLQVQVIDTAGKFIGLFPKRKPIDFHYQANLSEKTNLEDFFVDSLFFGITYSENYEGGKWRNRVVIFEMGYSGPKPVDQEFSSIVGLVFDDKTGSIFVADGFQETVYVLDVDGHVKSSIGRLGPIKHKFLGLRDLGFLGGNLYVLDIQGDMEKEGVGTGLMLIIDSSLAIVDTISLNEPYFYATAFDFVENGEVIVIIGMNGDKMLRVDNPVLKGTSGTM